MSYTKNIAYLLAMSQQKIAYVLFVAENKIFN